MKWAQGTIFFLAVLLLLVTACEKGRDLKPLPETFSSPPVVSANDICNHKDYCLTAADIKEMRGAIERWQLQIRQASSDFPLDEKLRIDAVLLSEAYSEVLKLDILHESTKFTLTLLNKMNIGLDL